MRSFASNGVVWVSHTDEKQKPDKQTRFSPTRIMRAARHAPLQNVTKNDEREKNMDQK